MNSAKFLVCTKTACKAIVAKNEAFGRLHHRQIMPVETEDGRKVIPASLATSEYWKEYQPIIGKLKEVTLTQEDFPQPEEE